uniref:Uncharacterized protein n=1 Tax=Streptomyces sp. 14R-10 TaxID=1442159 RepID=W0FTN6_9ACTN|nr:hypothetical protein [Streptomyces sp. 14R-10]AHF46195.1 hypothetical protein pZL1.30c [Streptomyces sp. 14R-10]
MTEDLWSLLRSTCEVQRMCDELRVSDAAGTTTPEQEREYRLRRAVLDQRHLAAAAITGSDPQEARQDAELTASMLWKHDAQHGGHRGPLPAAHSHWKASNLSDYVRQEADVAGLSSW